MTECHWCNEEIEHALPYQCNECGHRFCSDHRLPEAHLCSALRSDELRFGKDSATDDGDGSYSEREYPTVDPETYGSPKEPEVESSPDVTRDGGVKETPNKPDFSSRSDEPSEEGGSDGGILVILLGLIVLPLIFMSKALPIVAKLSVPLLISGMILVAFTPMGVSDHWDSSIAGDIDEGLEQTGDDIEAALSSNSSNSGAPTSTSPDRAPMTAAPTSSDSGGQSAEASSGTLRPTGLYHDNPDEGRLNEERIEELIHQFANDERGTRPIGHSVELEAIARYHSRNMAQHGELFHTSPEGNDIRDRLERFGADCGYAGENAAYTYLFTRVQTDDGVEVHDSERDVARGLVNQWMNSTGHRENLLNSQFTEEGIGVWIVQQDGEYRIYATQVLCE